ncbi:unnamed protein product [Ophioblennius macclurei]
MDSGLVKTREKASVSQMLTLKAFSMRKVFQMMHNTVQKSCVMACRFMCIPLHRQLCEGTTCCAAQHQQPTKEQIEQAALKGPRSTILIVNISNSTLNDCIIGDNSYQSTVTERQPLMQQPQSFVHGQQMCSCCHGQQGAEQVSSPCLPCAPPSDAEQLSINIQCSHLHCVIIGDNNYMHTEEDQPFE